jgi:hypothetical protein
VSAVAASAAIDPATNKTAKAAEALNGTPIFRSPI